MRIIPRVRRTSPRRPSSVPGRAPEWGGGSRLAAWRGWLLGVAWLGRRGWAGWGGGLRLAAWAGWAPGGEWPGWRRWAGWGGPRLLAARARAATARRRRWRRPRGGRG